jgi:hypothetical protein
MGHIFSRNRITAKTAAKMGAIYRSDTAVPIGKYLMDIKNKVSDVTPARPLNINIFLLFPHMGIL